LKQNIRPHRKASSRLEQGHGASLESPMFVPEICRKYVSYGLRNMKLKKSMCVIVAFVGNIDC